MTDSKPNWLADNEGLEDGRMSAQEYGESSSPPAATVTTTPGGGVNITAASGDDEDKRNGLGCVGLLLVIISSCLMALFVYSAIVQDNDLDNSRMWKFFYALSAAGAGAFALTKVVFAGAASLVKKPLGLLYFGLIVWSTVLVVYASIEVSESSGGESSNTKEGGDSDKFTESTEKAFEVAGAALCLGSALYHMILLKCCL